MPLLVNALTINAAMFNSIVAIGFGFLTWRFWRSYVMAGEDSDIGLALFFGSMTIDRIWAVLQRTLNACCDAAYPVEMLLARNVILILIIISFGYLLWVVREEQDGD